MKKKTDNSNLGIKVDLRRKYLDRYGGTACLDCCQGDTKIWGVLREEYPDIKYMGVDKKKKSGRHKIDSARLLKLNGLQWDVVDIDVYGDPFRHYILLYKNMTLPTTVFLTFWHGMGAMSNISNDIKDCLCLPKKTPQYLCFLAAKKYITIVLHSCRKCDIIAHDITHVRQSDAVEYFALRLTPKGKNHEPNL